MITRKDIFNVLFWIFLIVSIILILWKIFGNNPSDFSIMVSIMVMFLFKMWAISDDLKDFKHDVKMSFYKVKGKFNDLENKLKLKDK